MIKRRMSRARVYISLLGLVILIGLPVGCRAQTIIQVTATPGPTATAASTATPPLASTITICASDCDFVTIQAAIDDPGFVPGSTIEIMDPVHTEGDISLSKDVIIQGQGTGDTVVQAHSDAESSTDRIFYIAEGASVAIRDITIRHGHPDMEPRIPYIRRAGGGVASTGDLTLERVHIHDNIAAKGGGIFSRGTLTLISTTVSDNFSDGIEDPGHDCGTGGGVFVQAGSATVSNSTVSGNTAQGLAGGIKVSCSSQMTITNSTISGNSCATRGGGIDTNGVMVLVNSTIVHNSSQLGIPGIGNRGDLYISNCIVAYNTGGSQEDCANADFSGGGSGSVRVSASNLIEDGGCSASLSGDPLLGPLTDNGGDTLTHALLPDSPAIDVTECALTTDQRGEIRPVSVITDTSLCDLGAFELQPHQLR